MRIHLRVPAPLPSLISVSAVPALLTNANFQKYPVIDFCDPQPALSVMMPCTNMVGPCARRECHGWRFAWVLVRDDDEPVSTRPVTASLFSHCQVPKGDPRCGSGSFVGLL